MKNLLKKLEKWIQSRGLHYLTKFSIRELRNYGDQENGATRTYEQIFGEVLEVPE